MSLDREAILTGSSMLAEVDLCDWFDCRTSHIVTEEVIGLGSYGKVLTILSSKRVTQHTDPDDDDDDEMEEDLIERWTPRFRK